MVEATKLNTQYTSIESCMNKFRGHSSHGRSFLHRYFMQTHTHRETHSLTHFDFTIHFKFVYSLLFYFFIV